MDVAEFCRAKFDWLKNLRLPHGIPLHGTFKGGGCLLHCTSDAFEHCFLNWVQGLIKVGGRHALAINGKTLRGGCAPRT